MDCVWSQKLISGHCGLVGPEAAVNLGDAIAVLVKVKERGTAIESTVSPAGGWPKMIFVE